MYKMNVNMIRRVIVKIGKLPNHIREYDDHILCCYDFTNECIILDFTDEHIFITYCKNGIRSVNDEIISIYDSEYIHNILLEYASREEKA